MKTNPTPNKPTQSPGRKTPVDYRASFADSSDEPRPFSATINKPLKTVLGLLANTKNLPLYLEKLEQVKSSSNVQSEWSFKNRGGTDAELKIPMTLKSEPEANRFTFHSEDGIGFKFTVTIHLVPAPAGRGTIARMAVRYDNAVGGMASKLEALFGTDAGLLSKKSLQRFKAFCETGNVPTITGQSSGRDEDLATDTKH